MAAIVNFNTRERLVGCLASLEREGLREILVVDNASTDGSVAAAQGHPGVRIIANAANVGYGAAANQAVRAAAAPYVLLLNADTEVRPGAIRTLAAHLDAHPEVAVAAPRLEHADGRVQVSCFPFPGTRGWLLENGPLSLWMRHVPMARARSVSFRRHDEPRAVPWALGAALLLRREAVLEVGGFEESYFMYFEEVDLCRRLARAGWQTHCVPAAIVMHEGAASTSQVRPAMLVQRFRSTMEYYRRHTTGTRQAFWTTLLRMRWGARLVRDSARLLVSSEADTRERLQAQRTAWRTALFEQPARQTPCRSGRTSGAVCAGGGGSDA